MDEIIPDKRRLIGLVDQAHKGKLCLPNFQRSFVWPRDEVADLIRSIVRRYYIGSLLLLRCDPHNPPFAPEFLAGAEPMAAKPQPEHLILDGQQRLSSMMYALTAPDRSLKDSSQRRWFFLDLQLLMEDPDNDEIVFDRSEKELNDLHQKEVQWERRILPCTRLLTPEGFLEWRDGLDDWLREFDPDGHKAFRNEWRDELTRVVTNFQTFEVPLVELPRVADDDIDAIGRVCAIFEKLNSRGVELSVYDLLVARLYRSQIDLHKLWNDACSQNRNLNEWSGGKADTNKWGVLVLRTLALLRGLDPKPKILINLQPEGFEEDWRRAAAAIEQALEMLQLVGADGFGVFDRKWMPGLSLVPIMAALRAEIEERRLGFEARADLRRWYWSNVFLERYSSAVESKSRRDYSEFLRYWREGGEDPSIFAEAQARIGSVEYRIRESATNASAVYKGVFCLLALQGARDWRRGEDIQLQTLEDHHIFPKKYLKDHSITKASRQNSVVNRTLISDETNQKISGRAPSDYVNDPEIISGEVSETLKAHFIDDSAHRAMGTAVDDLEVEAARSAYSGFLDDREAAILDLVRRKCAVQVRDHDDGDDDDDEWGGDDSGKPFKGDLPSEYQRTPELDGLLQLADDRSRSLVERFLDEVASWPGCYVKAGQSQKATKRRIRIYRRGYPHAFVMINPSASRVLFRLDGSGVEPEDLAEQRTGPSVRGYRVRISLSSEAAFTEALDLSRRAHADARN